MPGVGVDAAIITRYFVCQNCHVIFQSPRMTGSQLDKFYGEGYYRRTLNLTDEDLDKDELYRAKTDAEIIKKHVGGVNSHLDVGCGRGYLLDEIGAKIKVGVEPDVDRLKNKSIKLYSKVSDVPGRSFDLITAIHVLEHESDPLNFLKKIVELVNEAGHIIIEVPTWKSPGGPLRLAHLYHFEPDVLRLMCKEVGLKVVETEFTPHLMLVCQINNSS
jgi:SAM-dependent methyltransferase